MNAITDSKICPFTGLEIVESNRWKNLKLAENYVISYRKIGDSIVDVHGYGHILEFDAERFQNFLDNFIEDQGITLPYVEMRNYEDVQGVLPTKRTIMAQKDYFIENKDKRIGFVAYNTTKAISMLLMSGVRQYKSVNVVLSVEPDYNHAVKKAEDILKDYSPYKKVGISNKKYKISSTEIEEVALACGRFLWEESDLFDVSTFDLSERHPLFPIVENLAIVREELIHLENESYKKSKALESEQLQTEKIVESLQSGIIIVDAFKDQVVDINPAACSLLEGEKEHIIGKPFSQFLMDQKKDVDYNLSGDKNRDNYLITLKEDIVPVHRNSVKITLNNKNYVLENFVDISEAKEHEEKLKKSLAHTKQINNLTFNREKRIIEMKKEVNQLLAELGREPKYKSVVDIKEDRGNYGETKG
ncbi:MAG: PAS domain-containing protein [Clostridiales bacterium]|nr:PAS domain-containing protein [Clostridiales bacterium]